jgi:hypothetical protein
MLYFEWDAKRNLVSSICEGEAFSYGKTWEPKQSLLSSAYVLGRVSVSVEDLEVKRDGRKYSYTANLVIGDGLGFDSGEDAANGIERYFLSPLFGWFFEDRDIIRLRTPLSGSGCCEAE